MIETVAMAVCVVQRLMGRIALGFLHDVGSFICFELEIPNSLAPACLFAIETDLFTITMFRDA
jgi:hypothetical protein